MTPLPSREAAELLGVSTRTVQRRGIDTVAALPVESQFAWARKPAQRVVDIAPPAPGQLALGLTLPEAPNLSQADREEAERRFRAIEPLVRPEEYQGLWLECRGRKLDVIDYVARENKTAPRTIYHWLKAWKDGGLPGLVTRERKDKGKPRALNAAALDFLVAAAMPRRGAYGELSVAEIYRAYNEERAWRASHAGKPLGEFELRKYARYLDSHSRLAPEAQLPAASYETFRTWFDRIPEAVKVMARDGGEQFSASQEIISFRAITEIQPLDYIVMDHRRLDMFAMVRDNAGGWKLTRPWLTAAIDMRTRKWLAWVIVESPSSDSIAAVLKRTFLDHGLPKSCYWDNGKDFRCEWLEGRGQTRETQAERISELNPAMRGVLETLGVRVTHAIVKRARAKIIEPNFLNTSHFDRSLPWWCGHKPGARPDRIDQLVDQHERWVKGEAEEPAFPTMEGVAALYDEFLNSLNEREHSGEGMRKVTPTGYGWMCPNEAWETLIRRVERRAVPADVLQFAFSKRKTLTVRQGAITTTFASRQYHYRMNANSVQLMALNGREVEVAFDPLDLGTVAVYLEGRFLGLAENVELRRMGENVFVQDERDRRVARREVKRFIKTLHSAVYVPDVAERANRRMAVQPARLSPEREEIAAAVPAAVLEAAEAKRADADVPTFEQSAAQGADFIRLTSAKAYQDDDPDDEFDFFSGGK